MGQEFQFACPVETRRMLWFMGLMFAVVVTFQYFEFPYGNAFSSLLSAGKVSSGEENGFYMGGSSSTSGMFGNTSQTNSSSTIVIDAVRDAANNSETLERNDKDVDNDFELDKNVGSNRTSWLDEDSNPLEESSSEESTEQNKSSTVDNGLAPGEAGEAEPSSEKRYPVDGNSSISSDGKENTTFTLGNAGSPDSRFGPPLPAAPPIDSSPNITLLTIFNSSRSSPEMSDALNTSSDEEDTSPTSNKSAEVGDVQDNLTTSAGNPSVSSVPGARGSPEMQTPAIVSIAEMNNLLLQSRAMHNSVKPKWSSIVDQELLYAKSQIENAPVVENDPELYAPLYRNVSMFKRSYELMENILKVYIYKEGQKPIFHQPVLKGIYASEGWFMRLLQANKKFVTKDGKKAHLFYLPFSSRMLEETLYVSNSHSHKNLEQHLKDYLDMIAAKYPFWNRTDGADHFLVACHDWAPAETRRHMSKCIRALCNSDVKEGYVFGKDVSLPETMVRNAQNPLRDLGGKPASQRSILAFFAGKMHGYLRPILLQHWGDKDPDMKIVARMPKAKGNKNYIQSMKSSKYCICPRGYEVNSPRIVEAIFHECVPVIISDNFVPPFFEILNWESFAVFISEKDVPNLKNILLSIPERRYRQMQLRVKKIQKHFLWHPNPPNSYGQLQRERKEWLHCTKRTSYTTQVTEVSATDDTLLWPRLLSYSDMDCKFQFICQAKATKLLIVVMGVAFASILVVQYFEFPYDKALSSVFSVGNSSGSPPGESSIKSESSSSMTLSSGLNTDDAYGVDGHTNSTKASNDIAEGNEFEGNSRGPRNNTGTEIHTGSSNRYDVIPNGISFDSLTGQNKNSTLETGRISGNGPDPAPLEVIAPEQKPFREQDISLTPEKSGNIEFVLASPPLAIPPINSKSNRVYPPETPSNDSWTTDNLDVFFEGKDAASTLNRDENCKYAPGNGSTSGNNSSATGVPARKRTKKKNTESKKIITISEMNNMLLKSHASPSSVTPRLSSNVDQELLFARSQIENAPIAKNDKRLYAPLYHNLSMFKRSYELMANMLKVYIYKDGEKPIFHQQELRGIYASEGWFMKLMEVNKKFVTLDPGKAHLFYLPFSSRMLQVTLYDPNLHNHNDLIQRMKIYEDMIATKYPFWNRTNGTDHFLAACHDWAPAETRGRMFNCIRALCVSDVTLGFSIGKDVALPETNVRTPENPVKNLGGYPASRRTILAFFAGGRTHGYLRPILLNYWENKDPDMKIFGRMPHVKGDSNYIQLMKSSKFCICPRGYKANSPRVVEAILYECVPVMISDNYVPPLLEVLNWESFAVFVLEKDIPNLKNILLSISEKRYIQMHKRVIKVKQHFLWHPKPVKYDLFHMILHSIWYNRVFRYE